jgi:wobble nucleotide-excising tRNase
MITSMGGRCNCCGYDSCPDALAFHHLDPSQKDLSFGGARANPRNWNSIVEELRKCILVCHNCHSEIHAGYREWPEIKSYFDESFADYKKMLRDAKTSNCPVCNVPKPIHNITCSLSCAASRSRKVDWESIDLPDLVKTMTLRAIAAQLNVSDAAVGKRLRKLSIDYSTKQKQIHGTRA